MPVWKPALSMTSSAPMATMNVSASIFISGCPLMKSEMGSMNTIMRITASMTAMIMMIRWSAMPTAVMTESMENTRSMTMMVPTACGSAMQVAAPCAPRNGLGLDLGELEHVAQLGDALVDEVAAADEQHQVAHRESVASTAPRSMVNSGAVMCTRYEAKHKKTMRMTKRAGQAQLAADVLLLLGQAVGGDGDEHQVVHAQHDLQEDEGDQADPRLGRRENRKIHVFLLGPRGPAHPTHKKRLMVQNSSLRGQSCTMSLAN